jgi:hypothetical protein
LDHNLGVTAEATAKANVMDQERRIMKTSGGYVQGYNAQAVVTEAQIIVADAGASAHPRTPVAVIASSAVAANQ